MMRTNQTIGCMVALMILLGAGPATVLGQVTFVPSDLNPGDTYHVAFITNGVRNGFGSSIGQYNTFVQEEAELSGAETENWEVDWFAIVSTPLVDAIDNIPVTDSPIYLLTDVRVADDADDLWDGTIQTELSINQFGASESSQDVWTGTASDGGASIAAAMGTGSPATGLSSSVDSDWVDAGNALGLNNDFALYAVSDQLTVETSGLSGDYDNSGAVGQGDLNLVLQNWGDTSPPVPVGWINERPVGLIGQNQLNGVLQNWGNSAVASTSAVPEPSTCTLALAALCLAMSRRQIVAR